MKKLLLIIPALFVALSSSAQHSVVKADKMNVMYIGIPNPITIMAEGYDCKQTSVVIPGATITSGEVPCSFEVQVTQPGPVTAEVWVNMGAAKKMIGKHEFRAKRIPDPVAVFAGKNFGSVPAVEAKAQVGVIARLTGFDFEARYMISSYTIEIYKNGKIAFSNKNTGARFDERTLLFLHQLEAGDKVIISDIKSLGPDKLERELGNIYVTLE